MERTGIYRITVHRPKGQMFYIGQASNMSARWRDHLWRLRRNDHENRRLQRAFNKHGENALSFKVILICEQSSLTMFEQLILNFYPAAQVYNICRECVRTCRGIKLTAAHRAKISAANKNRPRTASQIEAIRRSNRLRTVSAETRAKMSAARLGNKNSLGHKQTEEHKEKSRLASIGRKHSPESIRRRLATRAANRVAQGLSIY
jgi:group I intron endonuclease